MGIIDSFKSVLRPLAHGVGGETKVRIKPLAELFPDAERTFVVPPETVDTPMLDSDDLAPGLYHHRGAQYTTPGMFVAVLHNVLFCPTNHVILSREGVVVEESICTIAKPKYLDSNALSVRGRVRIAEPSTTFRSRWYNNYYHTLIDHLPRLYGLLQYRGKEELPDILVKDTLTPVEEFVLDKVGQSNAPITELKGGVLYELDTCIFVSGMCRRDMSYLPAEYVNWFRNQVMPDRSSAANRRIIVSRSKAGSRRMANEQEVARTLSNEGFEIFHLEDLSPRAQMELFYDAEAVVGMHGAGLANLVYSPHARVVECFSSKHFLPNYYLLAKSMGLPYAKVHGSEEWREDNTEISVSKILTALENLDVS